MKSLHTKLALLLLSTLALFTAARAQITPSADSYTVSADPTTNYGAKTLLDVDGATQKTYIQFNLSSVPAGATISQATLKLYVNAVTTAGSFEVYSVNAPWLESTIDFSNEPALGSVIDSSVTLTTAAKNQYILITNPDLTSTVQGWLTTPSSNNGIALVAIGTFNATFDSKENTTTSHPPELDIVFAGGEGGGITGITTASGSGLTGGGTSGTLNLSLINTCASGQVLQWNGSAWACASPSGTGTVTSVGSGTGLTGGPITGSGTLSINTAVVPQLGAANTFTGNQTVTGSVSATTGFLIGSNLFAFGSLANANAFLGFAGNSTTTGNSNTATGKSALLNDTGGSDNTANGAFSLQLNTAGNGNTAVGWYSLNTNTTGTYNSALGIYAGQTADNSNLTAHNNTAVGAGAEFSTGTLINATAIGSNAMVAENNALVLGSINGVNGATATTRVGIGTTAPEYGLDVNGTGHFAGNLYVGTFRAAANLSVDGFVNADTFYGSGAGLTGIPYPAYTASQVACLSVPGSISGLTEIGTIATFTKANNSSNIIIDFGGDVSVSTIAPALFVAFYLEVDGDPAVGGGMQAILAQGQQGQVLSLPMHAVFTGLATGSHNVEIWAGPQNTYSASGILVNSFCLPQQVVVEEF